MYLLPGKTQLRGQYHLPLNKYIYIYIYIPKTKREKRISVQNKQIISLFFFSLQIKNQISLLSDKKIRDAHSYIVSFNIFIFK